MALAATLAGVAALASPVADGTYRGDGVALVVRDGVIVRSRAHVRRFVCDPFGNVGPLRIVVRPAAAIGPDRRARFTAGPPSERLTVRVRFGAHERARGRLRVRGTIGTGDPCRSPRLRFVVGWSA